MTCVEMFPVASQTDISFTDYSQKYVPLETVYIHILNKMHEALFDLERWKCAFDKDAKYDTSPEQNTRDSIIKRAKRPGNDVLDRTSKHSRTTASDASPATEQHTSNTPPGNHPVNHVTSPVSNHGNIPSNFISNHSTVSTNHAGIITSPVTTTSADVFSSPSSANYSEMKQLDELQSLRLALSNAIQKSTDTAVLNNVSPPAFRPPVPINSSVTEYMNSMILPPSLRSPSKHMEIPHEYQLLDEVLQGTTKQEMLSPGSNTQSDSTGTSPREKIHRCPYCEAKFNQKSNLKTHIFGVHQFKLSTCRTCKIITSKEKLKEHMKTHPNRGFKCQQCDTSFDTHIRLVRHMKIHSSERPYKCSYCSKSFVYKWNLTEHVRIHTGEKPFVCRLCGKGFCQSSTLKRHSLAMHTTEKPYKCSQCNESFVRILLLKKHFVNTHLGGTGDVTSGNQVKHALLPHGSHGNAHITSSLMQVPSSPLQLPNTDALSMLHMLNQQHFTG